jgi:hypothetical protein
VCRIAVDPVACVLLPIDFSQFYLLELHHTTR